MRVNVKEGSGNHFYSTPASETTVSGASPTHHHNFHTSPGYQSYVYKP